MFPVFSYAYLNPPKFIGLIPPDHNLENENSIDNLCPKSVPNNQLCREEKLRPQTWNLTIYEKASADSKV